MSGNRLTDYLDHMRQAAMDACSFVEGMGKDDFLEDKRTQQAVIMSLIIIGEAATKVMDGYTEFTQRHPEVPWRRMRFFLLVDRLQCQGIVSQSATPARTQMSFFVASLPLGVS